MCGRDGGSVERWDTDGNLIEGEWADHDGGRVKSLSWSPSGDYIVSGTDKGMVLIHKAESGEIEVGPIETTHDQASPLSAPSEWSGVWCLWCGRQIAQNFTPPHIEMHGFLTVDQTQNFIASSTTTTWIPSHSHPNTMYWRVWATRVLHNYGIQNPINHLASHSARIITIAFTMCHSLEMGDTSHMAGTTTK